MKKQKQVVFKTNTQRVLRQMPDWQLAGFLSVIIVVLVFAITW